MVAEIVRMNKWSTLLVGVVVVAGLLLYKAFGTSGGGDVRFRLSFTVSVDGAEKTGSSIINVLFYGRGGTKAGNPYQYYTSTEGVAPVIDLGSHGWLIAAMEPDGEESVRRKKLYGLACPE